MRMVEMFHAGSPETVKNHVIKEMTASSSHLRVLICTMAFGMGIDCKNVYRSIHFGPSKTIEMLIQECGRLGRDGKSCSCYILFSGLLTAHCDAKVKELIQSKDCRRKQLSKLFTSFDETSAPKGCHCCDICFQKCDCQNPKTIIKFDSSQQHHSAQTKSAKVRQVSEAQKEMLYQKLNEYRRSLLPNRNDHFIPVGSLNILFEFGFYQISQVMKNCHQLFTLEDIVQHVELWRHVHVNNVYMVLSQTFDDMDELESSLLLSEEDFLEMEIVAEDWEDIRDDSQRAELSDGSVFENESVSFEDSLTEYTADDRNVSDILRPITDGINMDISGS